jgi:DNA-binding response OmpR family regulator
MLKRLLVIDRSEDIWRLVDYFVSREWHSAQVEGYHPSTRGKPGADFSWSAYDVVLLEAQLGLQGEDGLEWLQALLSQPCFPPAIVLTEDSDEAVTRRARDLGAEATINKNELSSSALNQLLRDVLGRRTANEPLEGDAGSRTGLSREELRAMLSPDTLNSARNVVGLQVDGTAIQVPGYRLVRRVARGGMATVFLAERLEDRLPVILKVLFTEGDNANVQLKRFMREYKLIGYLQHPHVARIYERAFATHFAYIAMEYFPSGDLAERIPLGVSQTNALAYVRQIADGLKTVHGHGIVHLDLKPGNILFRDDDSLALTDFGIAREFRLDDSFAEDDAILGTPYYMSPEQVTGTAVDERSDLYSLGVILFEMLTGRKPYEGDNIAMLVHAHIHERVPRLPQPFANLQPFLDGLLAKDPDERFQRVDELLAALEWL